MNCISENTRKLLVLSALKGVGSVTLTKLLCTEGLFGDLETVVFQSLSRLKLTQQDLENARRFADSQIVLAAKFNHRILSPVDIEYPDGLRGLDDSPPIIFVAGDVGILKCRTIAIIGTREPTLHGIEIAEKVTSWFAKQGWCVVSGLAKGVDTIAHASTLKVSGKTAAVLAHGLDIIYPTENKRLAEDILNSGGVLLSEYPYGRTVRPQQLVQRDKIQAGLSVAVVLVQSGLSGGSLHASRQIIKYSRPLVIVGQSKSDINSREPKIQANLALLNDDYLEQQKILKNHSFDRNLLVKMPSKDDFEKTNFLIEQYGWWVNVKERDLSQGFNF